MRDRIKRHVHDVLYKKGFDSDFEEEIANACQEEYDKALESGMEAKEAYKAAIFDFDNEYLSKRQSEYKPINNPLVPLSGIILTFITILIYTLARSFTLDEAFKYNALVIFVPIIIILFVKMLIVSLGFKGSVRYELYSIGVSTLMFIPFIYRDFC